MKLHTASAVAVATALLSASASLSASGAGAGTGPPPSGTAVRPNVVIIYADDLGWGDLGAYGHPIVETPNLDALAAQGTRFTAYYAPSPLCSPSRASLLTGRTHYRTGIRSWIPPDAEVQLPPEELTLAELLRDAGYQTAMAGKWHLNGGLEVEHHAQPGDHGFDHWLALHAWPVPHNHNPRNFFRNDVALGPVEGYTAQIVIDEAVEWLQRRDRERPFFLYLPMIEPHATIANPAEYNARYARFTQGQPDPFANGLPEPPANLAARGPGEYWANITYMDAQLGRLLEFLSTTGLDQHTIVLFASDNGPVTTDWRRWWEVNLYGDTGGFRGRKHDLYEGGIRVPAIVRWPGRVPAGAVRDAPIVGYDVMPTLAAMLGVGLPRDRPYDGEDFSPVFDDPMWRRQRPIYWEFDDDQGFHHALRDGDWKLLSDRDGSEVRLYDLARDRLEVFDRAPEAPEIVQRMLQHVRARAAEVAADPLLTAGLRRGPGTGR